MTEPGDQDRRNAERRQAIADRFRTEYALAEALACSIFGPGWMPTGKHYLLDNDEADRCRHTSERPTPAAMVITCENAKGEKRHFRVETKTECETVEAGFGESAPTSGSSFRCTRYTLENECYFRLWRALSSRLPRRAVVAHNARTGGLPMRLLSLIFAGLLAAGLAADDKADEWKRLDGEWKIVAAEMDGRPVETSATVRFQSGKCTVSNKGARDVETTVALDPGKKWMDVTSPFPTTTHKGIYELKGDTLKVVLQSDAKGERPTEFTSKKGLVMYTYERVKK